MWSRSGSPALLPIQNPSCPIKAIGPRPHHSSDWRLKERMINLRPWQRMQLEEASKLLPIQRPPLTAAVEPFPEYPGRPVQEPSHVCQVEGHPVVADVPPEFGTERGPEGGEALFILPGSALRPASASVVSRHPCGRD